MKLQDKVVVVTGSGNGIGEACARRFTAEGAKVVVTDVDAAGVERVADDLGTVGLAVDITVEDNVRAVADLARCTYGDIDVWYSNAGFAGPQLPDTLPDDALWELGWSLHVMAHVYAVRAVVPSMIERGSGYLLQTASIAALNAQVQKASYTVTKHATLALGEWLAIAYRPKGVNVSVFCPGPMRTQMLLSNGFADDHPLLRAARTPEQVADILVRGIDAERFLIVDDEHAVDHLTEKATDYDAWIEARIGTKRATYQS